MLPAMPTNAIDTIAMKGTRTVALHGGMSLSNWLSNSETD
jgi:hypothetical protein